MRATSLNLIERPLDLPIVFPWKKIMVAVPTAATTILINNSDPVMFLNVHTETGKDTGVQAACHYQTQ